MNQLKIVLAALAVATVSGWAATAAAAGTDTLQSTMPLPQGPGHGKAGGVCARVRTCNPHAPRICYIRTVCR